MTLEEFRAELRRLHPDLNHGNQSTTTALIALINRWKSQPKLCSCGRALLPRRIAQGCRFCSTRCAIQFVANFNRKPRKLDKPPKA